jgi:hypothetical protein
MFPGFEEEGEATGHAANHRTAMRAIEGYAL